MKDFFERVWDYQAKNTTLQFFVALINVQSFYGCCCCAAVASLQGLPGCSGHTARQRSKAQAWHTRAAQMLSLDSASFPCLPQGRRQGRRELALQQPEQRQKPSQLQEQPPICLSCRKQDLHQLQNRLRHSLG